jgi:hypothetical protein
MEVGHGVVVVQVVRVVVVWFYSTNSTSIYSIYSIYSTYSILQHSTALQYQHWATRLEHVVVIHSEYVKGWPGMVPL